MSSSTRSSRTDKVKPVRQSVTIPGPLAAEVRRIAKERNLTVSAALISLAEGGVRAELEAKSKLKGAYERFMDEQEVPAKAKADAGKQLIRAIFGKDAIAEDTLR